MQDNSGLILAFLDNPCLMLAGEGMLHFPGGSKTGDRPEEGVKGANLDAPGVTGVAGVRGLERALKDR